MRRLLITGSNGFLGHTLAAMAVGTGYEVYGTYRSEDVLIPKVVTHRIDLTDYELLKELFGIVNPDAVIHTAAVSSLGYCQEHPEESRAINVDASVNIAGLCADRGIPCVFTSTDCVFDGKSAPYYESDHVNPINRYGEQKVEAEEGMTDRCDSITVCRLPLMYGNPSPMHPGFMHSLIQSLRKDVEQELFRDEFRTPVSTLTASKGLLSAINRPHQHSLYHLGGPERVSRRHFGQILAKHLGLDESLITGIGQQELELPYQRAKDLSLKSLWASEIGYEPPSIEVELGLLFP